jgi:phytoene dehydrogenase-like protein
VGRYTGPQLQGEILEIDVAIIGAGLAGLNCALMLQDSGLDVLLFEASDAPGGSVRTDVVDGFRLDRGFQVLLTAYPETKRAFNYRALKLRRLRPGALVYHGGAMHRFADPLREPALAAKFLFDPVIGLADKLRVAALRTRVRAGEVPAIFRGPDMSTLDYLRDFGFSPAIIERFFEPFFGGVFLEQDLSTSSHYFQFLFRMFASGDVSVPDAGMEALPRQLAAQLKPGTLECDARVTRISRKAQRFTIEIGADRNDIGEPREIEAKQVVLAVAEHAHRPLLADILGHARSEARESREWNRTTTLYYSAPSAPVAEPILVLNGEGRSAGPINNLVVMSRVAPGYAPRGQELIAVSCVGVAPAGNPDMLALEHAVCAHATRWFGPQVDEWKLIAAYPIEHALPLARTVLWQATSPRLTDNVYLCSDAQEQPSLQGALVSGRRAAEAILSQRGAYSE